MTEKLQALLIEDSEDDAMLIVHELEHGGYEVDYERIDRSEEIERALAKGGWDVILCDHAMPQICAPEALQIVHDRAPDIPFIIVSGWMSDDLANSAKQSGARAFVRKNNLKTLVPTIKRELGKGKAKPKTKKTKRK